MRARHVACFVAATLACVASAAPPSVVSAWPDHGDVRVDPELREIRIEFDQAMSTAGQSICGRGPAFPTLTDKPRWEIGADGTMRVLVLPVKLEPEHEYMMSVNCPAANNCRSTAGEPAEPTPLWFKTGRAGDASPPGPTPDENREAIAALRRAIDGRYSYRDLRVNDWDAKFDAWREKLEHAPTRGAFARTAARLLMAAEDPHISLRVGEAVVGTVRGGPRANVDFSHVDKLVPGLKWKNSAVATGTLDDGVGYIAITSWSPELVDPVLAALDDWRTAPGIIIDVRANGGGDELAARSVAARFASRPAVYSKHQYREGDGFGPVVDRVLEPAPVEARCTGKVVVLMGPACMSSCESFLLMMRHGANAPLVGARSRGSSGNPKPVDLKNGVAAILPTWRDMLPDGTLLEGRGVEPDQAVEVTGATDAVLQAGLLLIRR